MTVAMSEQGVLSPTGTCKSFDAAADGFARGEAINAIYLKKLSNAISDGDPIRAIIRGSATNSDGKTAGLSMPSPEAQEDVIRKAYAVAGIDDFSETAIVECHGTGTPVGDPVETTAMANVFGKSEIMISSVKPNVGHTEGASGLTSTLKMVLALEKTTIPPNILFNNPNPKIPFEEGRLSVPTEPLPWPVSKRQRVGVSSYGISGANAHLIIDSAASFGIDRYPPKPMGSATKPCPRLLLFSANHSESLKTITKNYQRHLEAHEVDLADLSYTLSLRRNHLTHRTFAVANNGEKLEFSSAIRFGAPPVLLYAFTGQGAQWAGMSRELFDSFPSYGEDIRSMDKVLANCPNPPPWKIEDELLKPKETSSLDKAEYAQPLSTAIQIGIVNLLRSCKISPHCVVGHSSGEIAAAYAANSITASEAILIAYYRGQVTKNKDRDGGMVAIGLGREAMSPYLIPGVVIACENSPDSTTISGDLERLEQVMLVLKERAPEVFNRRLRVERAYHSHHMEEFGEEYERILTDKVKVSSQRPTVPMISSVTGKRINEAGELGAPYWRANLESPVLFHTAVNSFLNPSLQRCVFLEIGPHSALSGPLRQIFKASAVKPNYVPTLQRNSNCAASLLATLGQLHCNSVEVDFSGVMSKGSVLTNLPTYPWHYEGKFWSESRLSKSYRMKEFAHHDTLGDRVAETDDFSPTWRNILRVENVPWIKDHQIKTDIVFPGAGYIVMVGEAIRQLSKSEGYTVRNVGFSAAMVFPEEGELEVLTSLNPGFLTISLDSTWYDFAISSYNGTTWTKHCTGQVRPGLVTETESLAESTHLPRNVSSQKWYQTMAKVGLNYGPAFNGLSDISVGVEKHIAVASVVQKAFEGESVYALHPTTLDMCFQLFSVAIAHGQSRAFDQLRVPTFVEELYVNKANKSSRLSLEAETASVQGGITGSALAIGQGAIVFRVKGLILSPIESETAGESDPHAARTLQ